jgi:hypothetical protein
MKNKVIPLAAISDDLLIKLEAQTIKNLKEIRVEKQRRKMK